LREPHQALALGVSALLLLAGYTAVAPPSPPSRGQAEQARGPATAAAVTGRAAMPAAGPSCDPEASLRPGGPPRVAPGSFMARIRARGYLIAGVDPGTYHFGFHSPLDGQFEGFDIDMLHAIAKAIFGDPGKIEFRSIPDAQRVRAVQSGAVDIVAHTMIITCARLSLIDFSTVYFDTGQRVLVQKDSPVKGIGDLGAKKVCATSGSLSLANVRAAPSHPQRNHLTGEVRIHPTSLKRQCSCLSAYRSKKHRSLDVSAAHRHNHNGNDQLRSNPTT
jgi:polar amino acid transport system substrate-binding protein